MGDSFEVLVPQASKIAFPVLLRALSLPLLLHFSIFIHSHIIASFMALSLCLLDSDS